MKKILLIVSILGVFIYIFILFNHYFQPEIHDWEKNLEIPNINQNQYEGWGWKALKIDENSNKPIRKVKVAIIDSGIDRNHIDLKGVVKKEYNAISENSNIVDDTGHGTSVAGIIGAINNDIGIRGVMNSDFLEIYSIKAFQDNNSKIEYLVKALEWAIDNQVDLINFSAGTEKNSPELVELIDRAIDENIIIVAAAGNSISGQVDFPANLENVISVGAVNYKLKKISGTNSGKIDFVGPGSHILTTQPDNKYGYFGYTSAATAFVSGVILNKISTDPDRDSYNLESIYKELKKDVIDLKDKEKFGNGFIQN
ncbi:S8 family peptidase [Neobacillus thermocopriae]|uniref:S8 family peptidase n=1 Tax=Neobacillus thermocopriae TaxID=1215031 RepID=UPI00376F788E